MKDIKDYTEYDQKETLSKAYKVALGAINSVYERTHDGDYLEYEDIHIVKKALQTLKYLEEH